MLGLGLSGAAAARLLRAHGVSVVASDRRAAADLGLGELAADPGVELRLGRDDAALPAGIDVVVTSPGVAATHSLLAAARAAGVPVIAEVELAWRWLEGTLVAITGSNGKSTTTAMTGAFLAGAGLRGRGLRQHRHAARGRRRRTAGTRLRRRAVELPARDDRHLPAAGGGAAQPLRPTISTATATWRAISPPSAGSS